jgi:purine nucleosidase
MIRMIINKYLIFFLLACLSACNPVPAGDDTTAIRIILDTDMESDVDDVGALAMLHALADFGETEILGVIVCAKNPWSVLCADRINTYFNRENLPLGQLRGPGVDRESLYARGVAEEFSGTLKSSEDAPEAVDQYRRILASQPDNSVVILSIGYLTNLRDLINSGPDNHSNLDGRQLVEKKVRLWVCMGGQFPSGREANIRWDTQASVEAIEKWPGEIIFSGWEIGLMDTGADILDLPESSPVRRAYQLFNRIPHKNWDQVAVLYAVRGMDGGRSAHYWELSAPGRIIIDPEDGSNTWKEDPAGVHRHLIQKGSDEEIAREMDALMMHLPGNTQ